MGVRALSLRGGTSWWEEDSELKGEVEKLQEALRKVQDGRSSSPDAESDEVSKISSFSEETKRTLVEEFNNDSQWENKTLIPLQYGNDTAIEIQWQQENQHGDIQYFRRYGKPSPKFLEWKRRQIEEEKLQKKLKFESYQTADEIPLPASCDSDDECNWYWHSNGSMMWRRSGKQYYEPVHDFPDLDERYLGKPVPRFYLGELDVTNTMCAILNYTVGGEMKPLEDEPGPTKSASFNQMLEDVLNTRKLPDPRNRTFWEQFKDVGKYTVDHGICMKKLNVRPPSYDETLRDALDSCKSYRWTELVPSNLAKMQRKLDVDRTSFKLSGGKFRIDGELIVSERRTSHICLLAEDEETEITGRWRLRNVLVGDLIGLRLRFNNKLFQDGWYNLGNAQVFIALSSSHVKFRSCWVGGLGPLEQRARNGIICQEFATVEVSGSSIQACFGAGVYICDNATVSLNNSKLRFCYMAICMFGNAMARVSGCELKNMTSSIFFTQKAFIRTVRVELRNCSLAGLAWLDGVRPKRLLQKGVTMQRAKLDWTRAMRNTSSEGRERRSDAGKLLGKASTKKKTKKPSEAEEQKQMQQILATVKEWMRKGIVEGQLNQPYSWKVADKYRVDREEEKFWDGDKTSKYYQDPRYAQAWEAINQTMDKADDSDSVGDIFDYNAYLSKYLRGGGGDGSEEDEGEDERAKEGARGLLALIHRENISSLHLTEEERKVEAAKWEVYRDLTTGDMFYVNNETYESRWNYPRGLKYSDLHGYGATAHLCDFVIPDCLPRKLLEVRMREEEGKEDGEAEVEQVDWNETIRRGWETGDWRTFRELRSNYSDACLKFLVNCTPGSRIYMRLAEPYRFESEMMCDDPAEIDPESDWDKVGVIEFGVPDEWEDIKEERAWRTPWVEEYEELKEAIKESLRKEREEKRQGKIRKSYRELQAEYMARKKRRANVTSTSMEDDEDDEGDDEEDEEDEDEDEKEDEDQEDKEDEDEEDKDEDEDEENEEDEEKDEDEDESLHAHELEQILAGRHREQVSQRCHGYGGKLRV
ncbi:hypothetical protein GUITHDRAFT_144757 [Guillardia theta CCMP2712]|uniref:WW domain-containing protein n=1 Tax=Guillardia theta (strain CCMP2712) TaxID=905079 RepID=L1INE3_GUITC|nr:hypothetical protein GUITHDRAFT_144757 [Guillardia theta CCMP2712]EKX37791.1 hypothetical protein GUITHDRAFT_144757 [Guillardia theta CCMP2712]|eukprot:XP_005824771.1 hypothetical protein GUITHDRAFT_144757 [Guillardia theta CCMP2712]